MPKKSEPPKPFAKALTLFSQLLGFFSSSFNLKSYAEHSAIRVSIFIFTKYNQANTALKMVSVAPLSACTYWPAR